MSTRAITELAAGRPGYTIAAAALALVVVALAWRAARKVARGRRAEDVLTLVAAIIATTVAGTGMWRFFGVTLQFGGPLRVLLFAFLEVAVFTSALRARRSVKESITHSAGVDGLAVWALTGLSAGLSALDARSFAEAVFRLAAPMVAAWLWERSMSVERRRARGGGINWRLTPERVLVRLGLAEAADRTASEVDAHRRLTRVALAAQRLRTLRALDARAWRRRRAERRLDATMRAAIEHTGLTDSEDSQEALLAQIGALAHARELAELVPPAPWALANPEPLDVDPPSDDASSDPFPDDISAATLAWLRGEDDAVPAPANPHQVRAARVFAEEVRAGQVPGIKRLQRVLRIGQDRAYEVQAYLRTLPTE